MISLLLEDGIMRSGKGVYCIDLVPYDVAGDEIMDYSS